MKHAFSILAAAVLLAAATTAGQSSPAPLPRLAPPAQLVPPVFAVASTVCRARAAEAGRVADVLVWSSEHVEKGQPLARLSVLLGTPALRQAQLALRAATAVYARRPTARSSQAVVVAQARLAAVPRYVRSSYVVAPASGRLVRSLLTPGQYLPRAGTAALIEIPGPAGNCPTVPVALALR